MKAKRSYQKVLLGAWLFLFVSVFVQAHHGGSKKKNVNVAERIPATASATKIEKQKNKASIMTMQQYKSYVTTMILNHTKDVKACQKLSGSKGGRLVIAWEIGETGQARNFTRGEDTIDAEKFYHCLIKKIEKWKFNTPPEGRPLDVEHLFRL